MNRLTNTIFFSTLLGLLLVASAFTNIHKTADNSSRPKKALAITGKTLRLVAFDLYENNQVVKNLLQTTPDCEKDNTITFRANGTITGDNGTQHCPGSEPTNGLAATYTFNGKMVRITDLVTGEITDWEVTQQSSKTLTVKIESLEKGFPAKAVMVWQAN